MHRIAFVAPALPVGEMTMEARQSLTVSAFSALFNELRKLGYVEGGNLLVERYSALGRPERYAELAREATRAHPDLIVSSGNTLVRSLQTATDTIPIVAAMADPVAFGRVASLARPGANLTGISVVAGLEIWGKRLQILLEAIPGASRVGFLAAQRIWDNPTGYAVRQYAKQLGISVLGPPLESPLSQAEYRRVFEAMSRERADGVIVGDEPDHVTNGSWIVSLAEATRLAHNLLGSCAL
jgi:putative tryptophan/tyrosine transport system substrate-binding protein